jgi:hypothetical protein
MTIKKELVESYLNRLDQSVTTRNVEAAKLFEGALHGDRQAGVRVAEEISNGTLPAQLIPLIRRTLVSNYDTQTTVWDLFTGVEKVESIDRSEELMKANFLNQDNIPGENFGEAFVPGSLPKHTPGTKVPTLLPQGTSKYVSATSFAEGLAINWQSIVNTRGQGLNLINEGLKAFARHAAATEDVAATRLLMNDGAVNASSFNGSTGYGGNHLASDAPLASILDIQAAVQQAQTFWLDYTNVYFDEFALVVAPTQVSQAKQVLSSREITSVGPTASRSVKYKQEIDLGATINVVGNRWLTAPGIGGSAGATAWFLVPTGTLNPAFASIRLDGYEVPRFTMKAPNQVVIGGSGAASEFDFDSESIESKVSHVVGANALWTQGAIYSLGTGTATSTLPVLNGTMPTGGTTPSGVGSYPTPFVGS